MYKRLKNPEAWKKKIDDASTHEKKRNLLLYTIYKPITWYIILLQTNINFFRDKFLASNYNRFKIPYLKVYQLLFWCIIPLVVFELAKKKIFAHPDYRYKSRKIFFPKCSNIDVLNLKYIWISSPKNLLTCLYRFCFKNY